MDNLNAEIRTKILEFLKTTKIGASSSEIAKHIGHNRVTITKYLEIMKAHRLLGYEGVGAAKLWHIKKHDRPTVLIVDDEPHITDLVALSLIPERYAVIKSYSGRDCLEKVSRESPDLIILDLMMPGMNGYEVCRLLKENALTQHIPIIILSVKEDMDDKVRSLAVGADDYIIKPFDPMELEARVDRMIRRTSRDLDTHPLTRLPGKEGIRERLGKELLRQEDFIVHNFTLQNLNLYHQEYGYLRGDHALSMLSRVFAERLKYANDAFVGHTLNDHFVVITREAGFAEATHASWSRLIPYLYNGSTPEGQLTLSVRSITSGEIKSKHLRAEEVFDRLGVC